MKSEVRKKHFVKQLKEGKKTRFIKKARNTEGN